MATDWISVQEAARRLKTTHVTVHNWIATRKLRGKKLPPLGFWAVDARSVSRLAKERTRAGR